MRRVAGQLSPLLDEVRARIFDLAGVIGAPARLLPTFGRSEDFARPHIEDASGDLSYIVVERGEERARKTTQDVDELLYWVFKAVTHTLAFDYELEHRVGDEDSRVVGFAKQAELMEKLSARWGARWRAEMSDLLREMGLA